MTGWLGMVESRTVESRTHAGPIYTIAEWEQLKDESVGDLCGSFLTKDEVADFPSDSIIPRINSRVLGSIPANFQACVKRAKNNDKPDVIVLADGAGKAQTVSCAISNRCMTGLICDSNLAIELAKIKGLKIPEDTGQTVTE